MSNTCQFCNCADDKMLLQREYTTGNTPFDSVGHFYIISLHTLADQGVDYHYHTIVITYCCEYQEFIAAASLLVAACIFVHMHLLSCNYTEFTVNNIHYSTLMIHVFTMAW